MAVLAPANLQAVAVGGIEIDLTWDAVATAITYDIERNGEIIATTPDLSYQDFDVVPNQLYAYKVRTVAQGVGGTGVGTVVAMVIAGGVPQPITSLKTQSVAQVMSTSTVQAVTGSLNPPTGIQVPAPTGGSDTSMIQAIIDGAPNGSTINFVANATYLVPTGGIGVGTNLTQSGITLNGNNCLLFNDAASALSFRHCFKFGGVKNSGRSAIDCTIKNFRFKAFAQGNVDWGQNVEIRSESHDLLIQNCQGLTGNGDGFRIGGDGTPPDGPYNITIEDCDWGLGADGSNYHRHAASITRGHHITIRRCTFDKFGSLTTGGTLFDIEPLLTENGNPEQVHDVLIEDCTFRWYSPHIDRRSVQLNGGLNTQIFNITVRDCVSEGRMMGLCINTNGGNHPRFHDIVFTGNVSDPGFVCNSTSTDGPVVRGHDSDFITVTNNQANLGTAPFTNFPGCTNLTISGNVDTSP